MLKIILYIMAIVAANIITASTAPLSVGVLIIPYGTFLIGATAIYKIRGTINPIALVP